MHFSRTIFTLIPNFLRGHARTFSAAFLALSLIGIFFVSSGTSFAAFPEKINYQGKLTDTTGMAVADGDYNMRFVLHTDPEDPTPIWTEERVDGDKVTVTSGLFSIMLGDVESLAGVDFDQQLYLSVEIGGTGSPDWDGEMTPRKGLGAVPAAFVSTRALTLSGITADQFFRNDTANSTTTATAFLQVAQLGVGAVADFLGQSSAPALRINSDGLTGLGTTTPSSRLTLAQATNEAGGISFGGDTSIYRTGAGELAINGTLNVLGGFSTDVFMNGNTLFMEEGDLEFGGAGSISIGGDTVSDFVGTGLYLDSGTLSVDTGSLNIPTVGSGPACQVPYYAGSGTTLTATSTICISSLQMVGISSSTPGAKLSVQASGNSTGLSVLVANSSNAETFRLYDNGNILSGRISSSQTATPLVWSQGGTYGSATPGNFANIKYRLYDDGNTSSYYGIGMTSSLMSLQSGSGGGIGFYVNNGTHAMTVSSGAFVGIGTSTPQTFLHVQGADTSSRMVMSIQGTGATVGISQYNSTNTRIGYWYTTATVMTLSRTSRAFSIDNQLYITSGGIVGIGTTTPAGGLTVTNGSIRNIASDATMVLQTTLSSGFSGANMFDEAGVLTGSFAIANTATGVAHLNGHMFAGARKTSGDFIFTQGPASTVLGMWDNAGSFVIGASTTPSATRLNIHQFGGSPTVPILSIASSTTGGAATTTLLVVLGSGSTGIGTASPSQLLHVLRTGSGSPVRFQDANAYCEINPSTTTWTCTSDQNLKKDIETIDVHDALEKLSRVEAVTFRWKTQTEDTLRLGMIAQQVETVFPEFVTTDEKGYKAVAYGSFTPILVAAVTDLNARVKALEEQLEIAADTLPDSGPLGHAIYGTLEALFAKFARVETNTIKVNSGIELQDASTGEIYCVRIQSGDWQKQNGECPDMVTQGSGGPSETVGEGSPEETQEEGVGEDAPVEDEAGSDEGTDETATSTDPVESDLEDEPAPDPQDNQSEDAPVEPETTDDGQGE